MRQFAEASIKLDEIKIVEDSKCCLKVNAVIVKSGVYDYPDGPALKSPMELMRATRTARHAKLVAGNHPDTLVIMNPKQLFGGVEKPFWERNKMRAILNFDKEVTPKQFLERVREAARGGKPLNNSIGFYYRPDFTPGVAPDVNTGKERAYKYIMRDILIDHVAVGDFLGRCRAPQCGIGIGIDTMMRRISIQIDKVAKRGESWCVVHCHPDGSLGKSIKCYSIREFGEEGAKRKAEAMHRAIQARKHGASYGYVNYMTEIDEKLEDEAAYIEIFGDQDERPPKEWWDKCSAKARSWGATDPSKFCGWLWHHGDEDPTWAKIKRSYGGSSVSTYGGKNMSKTDENEYEKCLKEKKTDGMTDAEAAEACKALKPAEGAEELTPWQACIKKYTAKGMSMADAIKKCQEDGVAKTDQEETEEETRQRCIKGKMEIEGMTREEATEACTPKVQEGAEEETAPPQDTLPTPLEQCVANRMETMGEDEAEATAWCKDELAGLHEPAEKIVDEIEKLKAKADKVSHSR